MSRLGLILTLAGKDWRLFWADRTAALLGFAVPVALASGFAPLLGPAPAFCGVTLLYLLFRGVEGGLAFLRERRRGVWLRMRAAPVSVGCVLAARTLSTSVIALPQVFATFGFGHFAFGVAVPGSFAGFLVLALVACALAAAAGLLVAALGGTEARARNLGILVILAAAVPGGVWTRDAGMWLPTALEAVGLGSAVAAAFLSVAALRLRWIERRERAGHA